LSKKLLNEASLRTMQQALEAEALSQSITLTTKDTADAFAAFVEKREPNFQGR
jgi:2-(1,2-epoxy-1,2-dihydrophenyl)acetyl-CoA isomerase